jgi:hypothetical protein
MATKKPGKKASTPAKKASTPAKKPAKHKPPTKRITKTPAASADFDTPPPGDMRYKKKKK